MILLKIAWVFLKVGTFVFGGGMVLVPMLEHDVVLRHHWLTHREFIDAIALGQMTPGPLLVSGTFVGFKVAGLPGAVVATVCIFLPSFLMTLAVAHGIGRIRQNPWVQAFLRGVAPAVVGLIAAAAVSVGKSALPDPISIAIAVVALVLMLRFKVDAAWVVLGAGVAGLTMYR